VIKLLSSAGTGFFYTTQKNPTRTTDKLNLVKYDPIGLLRFIFIIVFMNWFYFIYLHLHYKIVRRHVIFNESKMASGKKR